MKIQLISEIPSAYRVDFFNALFETYGDDLRISFVPTGLDNHKKLIYALDSQPFWQVSKLYKFTGRISQSLAVMKDMAHFRPDVVITNGFSVHALPAMLYSKIFRSGFYTWIGGTTQSEAQFKGLKVLYRKAIASQLNGAVFYSDFSRAYLASLNPRLLRTLTLGNNTRNANAFRTKVLECRKKQTKTRPLTFLTVGFQVDYKNTETLMRAYAALRAEGLDLRLVVAGGGDYLETVKRVRREESIPEVEFLGNVHPDELPAVYADADVYVHPSYLDRWPQTYNEAAAAGLAILISTRTGVWDPYIEKYADKVIFPPMEIEQLAARMRTLINNPGLLNELKEFAWNTALSTDCKKCLNDWTHYFDPSGS